MRRNVLEYLETNALEFPDKIAFTDETSSVTYEEALTKVQRIGTYLAGYKMSNCPIVVFTNRQLECILSFLGVAYSHNFYAPIDVSMPLARITLCLEVVSPKLAIVMAADVERLKPLCDTKDIQLLIYEELLSAPADLPLLQGCKEAILDQDPLYLIFTSGSTGVPKGVIKSHRSIIGFITELSKRFDLTANEVFGNQAPFDFDVSAKDIYGCICLGASMVIIPKSCFSFPKSLMDLLQAQQITTLIWAASAVSIVAIHKAFGYKVPDTIKRVMFSGEVLPIPHLKYWQSYLPETTYVNLYAPTEVTGNCLHYVVDQVYEDHQVLPLGQAFKNMDVLLLNEANQPAKPMETGELYIRGAFLSLGYYNNPEKTREVFVQNPLHSNYLDLVYKTGDLAFINEKGQLVFASRKDFQIKHNGHRIELGEIEAAVNAIDLVDTCACVYDKEKKRIVLFAQGKDLDNKYIFNNLKERIPKYMFPTKTVIVETMPYNKNAKIDRMRLYAEYLDKLQQRSKKND